MRGDGYRCQLTVLLTLLILFPCGAGVWAQETGAVVQGEVALTPFEERLPPEEPAPVSGGTSQTVILSGTPTRGSLTSSDGGLPSIEFSGFEEQYVIDTNAFCWKQNWGRVSVPSECSGGEYDAGLCYPKCGEGYHGRANLCWRDCPEGYVDDGLTCRRPPHTVSKLSYGRTAGVPMICAPGQEAEGPLGPCYQACRDGYVGVGTVCWQDSCPEGYQNDPFTCRKDPIIEAKHSYDRGFGTPMVCGPGLEQIGGLCYPACRAGYHGELDWCRQPCPPGFHDDGVTCSAPPHATSADTSACPGWDLCCLTTHRGQSKCPEGYRNDGCTCFRDAKVIPQVSYHRGQEPLSTCPAGMDRAGGGALCYPNCRDGYVGNGPRCWSTCPEGYIDEPGTCRIEGNVLGKKSEGRGVGVAVSACPEGFEKDDTSALCYPQCAEDYHGVGPVCWNDTSDAAVREGCPAGYRDDGLTCTRDVHIFGNESQDRGVGVIPACAEDEVEESAGLCYKACERGFDTVGPVCWQQCPGNVPYEFGAACAGNQLAATAALGDMIFSAIDVLMNAVTVGGWTGAKIGLAGAETGAEAGIKLSKSDKLFKKIAQNLIKKNPLTKNPGEDAADFLKRKLSKKLADSKMQIFLREIDSSTLLDWRFR
ncbi:MAG: hypothetical protein U9Q81_10765 [Pseudomonadota bacterium]|nr:hypothetical protein [Pseudomonadota bacterium]